MLPGDLSVRILWSPTGEGWREMAPRLGRFLEMLASLGPEFAGWSVLHGRGGRARLKALESSPDAIVRMLAASRGPGQGRELLGASICLVAAGDELSRPMLSGMLGVQANPSELNNNLTLAIPAAAARLRQETVLDAIVEAGVLAWQPQWVAVNEDLHLERSPNWWGLAAGWKIWLSDQRAMGVPLPPEAICVERLGGVLIQSVRDFIAEDASHVAVSDAVQEALVRARLVPVHR